ncbi:hypothetical protein KAJ41_02180 [Candidatus Parcubacteria bacterium]|nr:hypothetical protein [Candidatus Parcubacteria bacterium]
MADSFRRNIVSAYKFIPLLEDYLRYLIRRPEEKTLPKDEIIFRYNTIKKMIDEENLEKPFADMPDEERRLLRSLNNSIRNGNIEIANEDLDDLRILICARNKIYTKNIKLTKRSVPLAIFGLIATIFFGFMSVKNNNIDYNEVQKIIETAINQK